MTQKQKFSPRTKHIALKYHHFREFVKGPNLKIRVAYVHTESQEADIFTKQVKDKLSPNVLGEPHHPEKKPLIQERN
jgi:hypothetical protein